MNPRLKFRLWQAWWLIKGVLHGHNTPLEAIRRYRNTRFIPTFTVDNPPEPGDLRFVALHDGTDLRILGRHIIPKPDGEVIP